MEHSITIFPIMFSPLDEINDWKLHTIMTNFKKIAWKYMNNNTKLILKNQEIICGWRQVGIIFLTAVTSLHMVEDRYRTYAEEL